MDFSHSNDPLEANKRERGLLAAEGKCRVSLSASFIAFAVAVAENCTVGGSVESVGTNWARSAALGENVHYKMSTAESPRRTCLHGRRNLISSCPRWFQMLAKSLVRPVGNGGAGSLAILEAAVD